MNFIDAIWPVPGPIAAALVAGLISFAITVLAKDQKTSEFRQAWIDGLRADLADFAGLAGTMVAVLNVKQLRGEDASSYVLERHDDFTKMDSLITRIRLRLNPDEHGEILEFLKDFRSCRPATSRAEVDQAVERVVACGQKILKSEWRRVKRGEPAFQWLKRVSLVFVVAALIGSFVFAVQASKGLTGETKAHDPPAPVATPKSQPLAPSSSG
ncbi:hypothetical protein [Pseudomonas fluorescens]